MIGFVGMRSIDVVSVETVTNGIESELHKVAAMGPTDVVDPFQGRFRIVLVIERAVVGIPGGDSGDVEVRRGFYAGSRHTDDPELLQQVAAHHVGRAGIALECSAKAE